MTTEEMLAEGVPEARAREAAVFDKLSAPAGGQVVLCGAGNLGRKMLSALRSGGVEPLAFTDSNPSLAGTSVDGVPVMSPQEASLRWGHEALFVSTIFRPLLGEGVADRLVRLGQLGCRRTTPFLAASWKFPGVLPHYGADLPSRLLAHAPELTEAVSLMGDVPSREVFRQQLAWRLHGDFASVGRPSPDQYFPRDVIAPLSGERIVDGGAYDGDTLRSMPAGYSRAWAIEPDPLTAARLRAFCDERTTVWETALGARPGSARFDPLGTPASSRSNAGKVEVTVSTLDELLPGESPTFLKLDVEGDERAALLGGRELLRRSQPVVAVCVYHRPDDLWAIPLLLHEMLPGHRQYLRSHENDGFELVAYAVPGGRCR